MNTERRTRSTEPRPRAWWKQPAVLNAALGWLGILLVGGGVAWLWGPVALIVVGGLLYVDTIVPKR